MKRNAIIQRLTMYTLGDTWAPLGWGDLHRRGAGARDILSGGLRAQALIDAPLSVRPWPPDPIAGGAPDFLHGRRNVVCTRRRTDPTLTVIPTVLRKGGCVATERKAGKFRLFILFIGITEWTQIAPSNGF